MIEVINNPSIAAFVGAFSAFALVMLTDWNRRRIKISLIKRRIEINFELAIDKQKAIKNNIDNIVYLKKYMASPIMKFPIEDIRILQRETLDILSISKIHAIDALIYWMEAIDSQLDDAYKALCVLEIENIDQDKKYDNLIKARFVLDKFQYANINIDKLI